MNAITTEGRDKMKKLPRDTSKKAQFIASAWEKQAGTTKFSGFTLAQYQGQITAATNVQDEIVGLERELAGKREEFDAARKTLNRSNSRVVSAVRGDPDHGSDSPLLAAMGYVTDSQRKT